MSAVRNALVCSSMLALGLASTGAFASSSAQPVDPQDYPKLTAKELGHIRHLVKMANQLPGDWSGFGSLLLLTERTRHFQVAFAGMTLALAQHQYTPAYRELYKEAIEAYIQKLQHPDIWERWMFSSRGGARGGLLEDMHPGWMDPVAKDNIMLKAYLLQLGAAHEMLYGDRKYDRPDAFTFLYNGYGYGNGLIKFTYSLGDIARIIHQEVVDSNYVGAACEPARIFWACNAPSSVGFMHYDHVHGTDYAAILPKMKRSWIEKGYINPNTYRHSSAIFTSWDDRGTGHRAVPQTPMANGIGGWSGMFNHAWDADFVKAAYLGVDGQDRNETLQFNLSGQYAKAWPAPEGNAYYSLQWGLFLAYAAEVGDKEAVDKMLAYAERNYGPVWENGEYYYPRNDDYAVDEQGNSRGVDPWTGNVLIPLARINKGGGFHKLYNELWGEEQYRQPYISDVDRLSTNVSQAFYDKNKDALIVTLSAGPIAARQVQFTVRQLDPGKVYTVTRNGKVLGRLDRKTGRDARKNASLAWREDDTVLITTEIATEQTFVISAI